MPRTELFGTDGVRGVAGEFLTAELALALGRAATERRRASSAARAHHPRHARVGRDARGGARGRASPRPGGDALPRRRPADARRAAAARAATASTSPPSSPRRTTPTSDNGIKFFGADGYKLVRRDRGGDRGAPARPRRAVPPRIGRVRAAARHAARTTCARCTTRFADLDLSGRDVLLDCANGATYRVAPGDLPPPRRDVDRRRRRARRPQHQRRLGSTHVDALAEHVVAGGHDLGFAFDGDGDRVLAVDRDGASSTATS